MELGEYIFEDDFKDLFEGMCAYDENERYTIEEVLEHPWIKGQEVAENYMIAAFFLEIK